MRINEQIRVSPIRVVSNDGTQLGIIPTEDALKLARDAGLDLVEVAPNEEPPVCRIMDYGKFKYQQRKKQTSGKVHHTKTKEIRLRPKTGQHDIDFKVKQAKTFLENKDKVQVSVVFRGREIVHVEEGTRQTGNPAHATGTADRLHDRAEIARPQGRDQQPGNPQLGSPGTEPSSSECPPAA